MPTLSGGAIRQRTRRIPPAGYRNEAAGRARCRMTRLPVHVWFRMVSCGFAWIRVDSRESFRFLRYETEYQREHTNTLMIIEVLPGSPLASERGARTETGTQNIWTSDKAIADHADGPAQRVGAAHT